MRYVSGALYAAAIAGGSGALLNSLGIAICVFAGTVTLLFAIEAIVKDALTPRRPLDFITRETTRDT